MKWKTADKIKQWAVFCGVMWLFDFILRGAVSLIAWSLIFGAGCAIATINWQPSRWCKTAGRVLFWAAFIFATSVVCYTITLEIKGRFSFWENFSTYVLYGFGVCTMAMSTYMAIKRRRGERESISTDGMIALYAVAVFTTCVLLLVARCCKDAKDKQESQRVYGALLKHFQKE